MEALVHSPYWPFAILFLGIAAVVVMISKFRMHPFIALMIAAIVVGLISVELPGIGDKHHLVWAVELPMMEFGTVAGKIAWVIALAAIIGTAMMQSGAAQRIVNWLINTLGEKRAPIALLISGFVLSIPVFFDTVFFLLIPLAIALALKTGKNYVLYVMAMAGGAAITHSMVPPTPGPLIMAETLNLDLGLTILAGLASGLVPALAVLWMAKRMEAKLHIPVRVAMSNPSEDQPEPSLILSILPVVIPIVLISLVSITEILAGQVPAWMAFWGNKNIAMTVGTSLALWLWLRQKQLGGRELWEAVGKPLEIAGIIILITSAGGAFGAMIKHSGIGSAIETATESFHISYLVLAWLIAAVMKTAQGSGTVSMITTASIMLALMGTGVDIPYHPMYILLAIGFGSLFISWMNDSGFWVVAKMSGFTEKEALQTWTVLLATLSIVGLAQVLLMSWVLPFN
ncbi:MAG: GntP family permease [Cyclobacteriaceae bacterium]